MWNEVRNLGFSWKQNSADEQLLLVNHFRPIEDIFHDIPENKKKDSSFLKTVIVADEFLLKDAYTLRTYITLILLLWDLSTLFVVDHLWPLIYIYSCDVILLVSITIRYTYSYP